MKDQWHINYYQKEAIKTAIYPDEYKVVYPALGLAGEAGEVADKVKKIIRDGNTDYHHDIALELGDVLWYIASLANDLGYTMQDVAQMNIEKLKKRSRENKLQGSGDNR